MYIHATHLVHFMVIRPLDMYRSTSWLLRYNNALLEQLEGSCSILMLLIKGFQLRVSPR